MVSSTLNPQAITKSRPATPNSFGSFMTGESSLGNRSSLTEASNKIVKFSNPTVSTVPLDISSLLTNISTNILNQVDNSIKNTTNFIKTDINRDFEKQLNNLRSDIYSKLDEIQNNTKYLQKDVIKTTNEIYQQIITQSPTKIQKEILEKIVPQLETRILELTKTTSQPQVHVQKEILEKIVPQLETRILELTKTTSQPQVHVQKEILEKIVPQLETRILELTKTTSQPQVHVQKEILEKIVPQLETRILELTNTTSQPQVQKEILEKIVPQLETRILELTKTTSQPQVQVQKEILEKIVPQLETRILELTNTTSQPQVQPETSVSKIQQTIINIQEQANIVLDNTLKSFSQDYQEKIKGFDDKRPNNVLSKFLDLYQNAIGFINFFGDRKNINTVEKNLKSLRVMFEESFEVAKVLRQTIVKIVKQLSNLPSASPSAGGLNLDVNIPGGRLKQAGGPKVRNVGRGAGLGAAAGIGLLGLGGLATAASGMGRAKQYQEEMLASGVEGAPMDQSIPEGFIDTFSNIVDRFTSAIEGLVKGAKSSPGSSSSGGGGGGGPSPSPGSPGGGAVASGSADEKIAAYTSVLEGTGGQNAADAFQVMLNRTAQNHSGYGGLGEQVMARGQFTPIAAAIYGTSGDNAANRAYGHIAPMLGKTPEERKAKLRQIVETEGMQGLDRVFNKNLAGNANVVLGDFKSGGPLSQAAVQGVKGREYFKGQSDLENKRPEDFYRGTGGNYFHGNISGKIGYLEPSTATAPTPTKPGVAAAPAETQMTQTRAQAISQPAQQIPTTINLSPTIIDASPPQQAQQQSGGVSAPPPSGGGSIEVPMLPTTNPDNFLTMYSRIVYNIVDG
jgi:predicted DNA-binding protein